MQGPQVWSCMPCGIAKNKINVNKWNNKKTRKCVHTHIKNKKKEEGWEHWSLQTKEQHKNHTPTLRRRAWQPTSVFLPGESHGQKNLVGYSPWGHKESDRTKWLILPLPQVKSLFCLMQKQQKENEHNRKQDANSIFLNQFLDFYISWHPLLFGYI